MTGPTDSGWAALTGETERQKMELSELRARMDTYEHLLAENTVATKSSRELLGDVHEWLTAARKGLQVLGWIGSAAKWIAAIVAGAAAVFEIWRRVKG